ncbi:MAG: diaminopimelate epimerase [Marinilabiliales bacterium]|nr:MAG: diaminopimelate epimerase [Marinilabiliales bacterium]
MSIRISKYHGAGNDFLIVDQKLAEPFLTQEIIKKLCHRRFGIGADGLIVLSREGGTDFTMEYYNSDGNLAEMCGNGARCAVAWANHEGWVGENARFLAGDGLHVGDVLDGEGQSLLVRVSLTIAVEPEQLDDYTYYANTGVPHNIRIIGDVDVIDVEIEGRLLRNNDMFAPDGANINFVSPAKDGYNIRTYERGVEGETLACGTGVAASALILNRFKNAEYPIVLHARGGTLIVEEQQGVLMLTGPAQKVFDCNINPEAI